MEFSERLFSLFIFFNILSFNLTVWICNSSHLLSSGAIHGESGGKREGAGPQTEDPDAVGGLFFFGGQDSPNHTGGQPKP